jgi:ribose transport system permease protein
MTIRDERAMELDGATGAGASEALLDSDVSLARPLGARLREAASARIFVVLIVLWAIFAILKPGHFATAYVIRSIFTDTSILLVMGVGMTFVIITAGIDLSIGSVLVFSSVIGAEGMVNWHWSVYIALVASVAGGLAWGLLNGVLITKARVQPLIVTLASLLMALGAAELITSGTDVANIPSGLVNDVGFAKLFGQIPWLVVIGVAVAVVGGIVLHQTSFGRYTYAVGSNAEAARRAGINVDRHLIKVYCLMGGLAGLAGYLSLARFATTSISGNTTDGFQVISGVALGGTSLFGGRGGMTGTCIGMLIPITLQYGFVVLGVQPFWENIAVGATLVAAVFLDQLKRRGESR